MNPTDALVEQIARNAVARAESVGPNTVSWLLMELDRLRERAATQDDLIVELNQRLRGRRVRPVGGATS